MVAISCGRLLQAAGGNPGGLALRLKCYTCGPSVVRCGRRLRRRFISFRNYSTTSMTNLWQKATGPSAALVQQQYVAARLEDIKRRNPGLEQKVAQVLTQHPLLAGQKFKGDRWLEVYRKMNRSLQCADLTINFRAESWFTTENTYSSYTQMYERSAGADGKNKLFDDPLNPANLRARVDDAVTFPAPWSTPAPPAQRGIVNLTPGRQSGERIQTQMAFGSQHTLTGAKPGVESGNRHFNPKTKQIFAALNYGRRPHGSSLVYGDCQLVLQPRIKINAMYYGGDTFFAPVQDTSVQVGYGMLAAVIAHAHFAMVTDIVKSCFLDMQLDDMGGSHTAISGSMAASYLLEGHVFGALPFAESVSDVRLPGRYMGTAIGNNAFKFASKHGTKLTYLRA